ncbi:hypothetical protein LZA78_09565 [Sinirhodobacter sp. WL0062]|uniref:PH domain-containing protein n=1 Tax=Rhodobacter flavimaris TaxID=2907145 RepID=A0ABS8YYN8_9RHOB|nr:hypothetical protein [Sinirhodobacter sp. WL0062]MCE5973727.1 hypothetical protein [Sinirhodobacter sp. WL0062]
MTTETLPFYRRPLELLVAIAMFLFVLLFSWHAAFSDNPIISYPADGAGGMGARAFFMFFAGCATVFLIVGLITLVRTAGRKEEIVLGLDTLSLPGPMGSKPVHIPYRDITALWLHRRRGRKMLRIASNGPMREILASNLSEHVTLEDLQERLEARIRTARASGGNVYTFAA